MYGVDAGSVAPCFGCKPFATPTSGPLSVAKIKDCLLAEKRNRSPWAVPLLLNGADALEDSRLAGELEDDHLTVTWIVRPTTDPILQALIRRLEKAEAEQGLGSDQYIEALGHLRQAYDAKGKVEKHEFQYIKDLAVIAGLEWNGLVYE